MAPVRGVGAARAGPSSSPLSAREEDARHRRPSPSRSVGCRPRPSQPSTGLFAAARRRSLFLIGRRARRSRPSLRPRRSVAGGSNRAFLLAARARGACAGGGAPGAPFVWAPVAGRAPEQQRPPFCARPCFPPPPLPSPRRPGRPAPRAGQARRSQGLGLGLGSHRGP